MTAGHGLWFVLPVRRGKGLTFHFTLNPMCVQQNSKHAFNTNDAQLAYCSVHILQTFTVQKHHMRHVSIKLYIYK